MKMSEISKKDVVLYKQALDKWGILFQIVMLGEEFGELFKEISKGARGKGQGHTALAEEFADVYIMLEQMQIAFNIDNKLIRNMRAMKLGRLEEILKKAGVQGK